MCVMLVACSSLMRFNPDSVVPVKHFWGFSANGDLVPDIVTMGKPMGNGHPIASVVAQRKYVDAFSRIDNYFNTFGGNPVSCAAALAVLDVIEEEALQDNAAVMGDYMVAGLRALAKQHDVIGDVRGNGLFTAVELVADRDTGEPATAATSKVVNGLRDRGVLTSAIGLDKNILKLRPPLVIGTTEIDLMLAALDESLRTINL